MFTGLVEEVGTIVSVRKSGQSILLAIRTKTFGQELVLGESVAVNGVCLTVTSIRNDGVFFADVTPETFSRTSFASFVSGRKVNLERAMKACGRFGGHIVSGHIDGTAKIASMQKEGNSIVIGFTAQENILCYVIEKGSVAIDGISLTVAKINEREQKFFVSLIPHSFSNTTLQFAKEGDVVNIECDMFAKYAEKFLQKK